MGYITSPADADDAFAVVSRYCEAVEQGDLEIFLSCFAIDARVWHNFDNLWVDLRAGTDGMKDFFANFPLRRFSNVRVHPIQGGVVRQHDLNLRSRDGATFVHPICIIVTIASGKIKTVEEYVDVSKMA